MKFLVCIICAIMIVLSSSQGSSNAEIGYRIAIVYSHGFQDVREQKEIKDRTSVIREARPDSKIMSVYLNYDKQMSEQRLHENAASAFRKIQQFRPNLTIVYDNIAFEHVAVTYLYPNKFDTIFINVWKPFFKGLSTTNKLDQYGSNVSGVLLDGDAPRFKCIMRELDLQHIYIIKNNERGYSDIATAITKQLNIYNIQTYNVESTVDLGRILRSIQSNEKGMIIFLLKDLAGPDGTQIATPRQIATTITNLNSKHFELSYLENYTKYGVATSDIVTNRQKNKKVSVIDQILVEKINTRKIESKDGMYDLIVNIDRVKTLGFDRLLGNYNALDGTDGLP